MTPNDDVGQRRCRWQLSAMTSPSIHLHFAVVSRFPYLPWSGRGVALVDFSEGGEGKMIVLHVLTLSSM